VSTAPIRTGIRWFDARWLEPGTQFHHSVGFGILHIRDRTTGVQDELPSRLVLAAGMGPLGKAEVDFTHGDRRWDPGRDAGRAGVRTGQGCVVVTSGRRHAGPQHPGAAAVGEAVTSSGGRACARFKGGRANGRTRNGLIELIIVAVVVGVATLAVWPLSQA
jgi:hypothetical protein